MCGIVAVITKKPNGFSRQQQDVFTTLLFLDTFRGADSTGLIVVNNEGDLYLAKDALDGPSFIQTKEYEEAQRRAWNRGAAMIGHNRAATRGIVNDTNAHPFNVKDEIFLVHNGTMRGDHRKHADVAVDSHAIAHLIHEKEDLGEALSAFDAAFALSWYDLPNGELNFIRNDERPLFWMEVDDAWLWASEACMLEFAASRHGLSVKGGPTLLLEHYRQKFTLQNRGWQTSNEKVEVKKPVSVPQQSVFTGPRQTGSGGTQSDRGDGETFYEDFDWEGYTAGMYGGDRDSFRNRNRRAEEWADERRDATAAQRHRGVQQHPRHTNSGLQPQQQSVIQLLPRPPAHGVQSVTPVKPANEGELTGVRKIMERSRQLVEAREPLEFAGCKATEREMAVQQNKLIHYGHYRKLCIEQFPYNKKVLVTAFDYRYVNGKDATDGFYLYSCPVDDEDIIVRKFMSSKVATEERMIQIAGCNYVYEMTLGNREWSPANIADLIDDRGVVDDQTAGFVIIKATSAALVSSGVQSEARN